MASNSQRLGEGNTDGSEPNTSSTNELAEFFGLPRGAAGELVIIQTLQRLARPIFLPILRPLIRELVREEFASAQPELSSSKKEIPVNRASPSSVLKRLKTQFRNRVSQPVFTGMPLLGENKMPIEIALVDADTEQIVNTGTESTMKVEIIGCPVGDDDGEKESWIYEEFQKRILGEKKGKQILQGNTCVQLKEGIGFVGEISFTFNSTHTKNGCYRLGAVVVDAALMKGVEVAWTETFLVRDRRATYSVKHSKPSLFDKVCHLQQISYRGNRYKRLKGARVNTVKDLLTLLYTDPKRLEDILGLVASNKIWNDIVNHAQMSDGMFLYLDPSNEQNGVVLDVKLQLKGLVVESHHHLLVDQLSDQQKVETQNLVKFACEHLEVLLPFEDETSLIKHLQSGTSLPSVNQTLGSSKIIYRPSRPSSQTTSLTGAPDNSDISSFLHMSQSINQAPALTSRSDKGKEVVSYDDEMIYSTNYYPEHILSQHPDLESPNGTTESGTSFSSLPCGSRNFGTSKIIDRSQRPSECNKIITSHKKGRFDHPQMSAWSPDTDVDIQYLLEAFLCDPTQNVDMQNSDRCRSEAELQSVLGEFLFPRSAIVKAQRRWKIVSSVVEWFSLMSEIRKRGIIKPWMNTCSV